MTFSQFQRSQILRTPPHRSDADLSVFPNTTDDAIVVVEERAMIQGLKLAFTGQEILRAIDERIARLEAAIQFKRDEIDGKIEPRGEAQWQVSVEEVQQEIATLQHRIDVQTMYQDRLVPSETYLLGKRAMRRANLLPREPPPLAPGFDDELENQMHWVTRSA